MKGLRDINENEDLSLQSFLTFKLDEQTMAIPVMRVVEIQELASITRIPNAAAYMAGVLNLRGKILPVIDAKIRFGLSGISPSIDTCIVVIETLIEGENTLVGIIVDAVVEVLDVSDKKIQPSNSLDAKFDLQFVSGVFKQQDQFITLLNIDRVCTLEENAQKRITEPV